MIFSTYKIHRLDSPRLKVTVPCYACNNTALFEIEDYGAPKGKLPLTSASSCGRWECLESLTPATLYQILGLPRFDPALNEEDLEDEGTGQTADGLLGVRVTMITVTVERD